MEDRKRGYAVLVHVVSLGQDQSDAWISVLEARIMHNRPSSYLSVLGFPVDRITRVSRVGVEGRKSVLRSIYGGFGWWLAPEEPERAPVHLGLTELKENWVLE
jgi:hypothetical protein